MKSKTLIYLEIVDASVGSLIVGNIIDLVPRLLASPSDEVLFQIEIVLMVSSKLFVSLFFWAFDLLYNLWYNRQDFYFTMDSLNLFHFYTTLVRNRFRVRVRDSII